MPGELNDFTPFGYLYNPAHRASAWGQTSGGNLRSMPDGVGVEWVYPVGRDPTTRIGLVLETFVNGQAYRSRADFETVGLTSRYHSALIFGYDWHIEDVRVEARFFLASPDALCSRLVLTNEGGRTQTICVSVGGRVDDGALIADSTLILTASPPVHVIVGSARAEARLPPRDQQRSIVVLARADSEVSAQRRAAAARDSADDVFAQLLEEDAHFYERCPDLSGDWPAHWREGLHHDFQTTRLLVQPPGGIFKDVWPSWMSAWPRAVLAEGTLDMLRLAYADPALAKRASLSLFRDAPAPNLPCIFQGGEYNMVAADGSHCGTAPSWCLPFLNLELLYLRTLDREWLAELFPYASAYLEWWLQHRIDAYGWLVYRCTWESGEDGNPRLDPSGSGDADISWRLRPVELQATMSHAARVMAFFADELGLPVDRWLKLSAEYRDRTRGLFDAQEGRYRDWLIQEERAQEPCQDTPYWGIDACRYSAQSLTPLLIGEPLDEAEIWRHACPPWTLWPSWTWSLVESAAAAGLYAGVGALAYETIDRVYRATARRQLEGWARPMPGNSPEFWPIDWRTYGGSDAYGWGATTANLLIRHLFGFKESRARSDGWVAELTPALPQRLLQVGGQYGIRKLSYRGLLFDLWYEQKERDLYVRLELGADARECTVDALSGGRETVYASGGRASSVHVFPVRLGQRYVLRLG